MWGRPTDANESSSSDGATTDEIDWPTPTASDYGSSQNGICAGKPSGGTPSLSTLARTTWATPMAHDGTGGAGTSIHRDLQREVKEWSTPIATDGNDAGGGAKTTREAKEWPTPLAEDTHAKMHGETRPSGGNPNLPMAASLWPTACTTDAASSGRASTTTDVMHPGVSLTDAMRSFFTITDGRPAPPTKKGGRGGPVLDPRFVEALMGFPDGWTVPASPRDFAALASELLETRSSASKAQKHSSASCDEPSTLPHDAQVGLFAEPERRR